MLKCRNGWRHNTTQLNIFPGLPFAEPLLQDHVADGGAARPLQGVLPLAGEDGGVEHCLLPAVRVVQEAGGFADRLISVITPSQVSFN